jgi:hypothetical protein
MVKELDVALIPSRHLGELTAEVRECRKKPEAKLQ